MAQIHNTYLFKELKDGAKIAQLRDKIPTELAEKVIPVMEVNPKLLRRTTIVKTLSRTATGDGTIYTTPADQEFYLTGLVLTFMANATADNTDFHINGTPMGAPVTNLLRKNKLTTTADSGSLYIQLPHPLLMEKNTVIQVGTSFTAGAASVAGTIYGYIVDNSNA